MDGLLTSESCPFSGCFRRYHQVRKWLLVLDDAESGHTKYWRPSFLVLVDDMQRPYNLLGCLETLKKGGLLVLGGIVVGCVMPVVNVTRSSSKAPGFAPVVGEIDIEA